MGILKSLFTLGKSFISQAEESIEETQGVRMLEQHIRDAKAELDKAGKSRVDLLARVKLSHDKLKDLRERKASLEARALEALSKNVNPSLINEVAEEIARLENLKSKCCRIWKSPVMAWKKQLQRQRSVSLSLSSKWKSLKPLKPCSVHNRL
jgi:phage shock protein A